MPYRNFSKTFRVLDHQLQEGVPAYVKLSVWNSQDVRLREG